ncbi:hypothetical protein F4808DRAFT_414751 [Astrocystis sublimbata]|nr:hypothetical protein F4808DRAFT_414751 [Astrocystis sublimbata]
MSVWVANRLFILIYPIACDLAEMRGIPVRAWHDRPSNTAMQHRRLHTTEDVDWSACNQTPIEKRAMDCPRILFAYFSKLHWQRCKQCNQTVYHELRSIVKFVMRLMFHNKLTGRVRSLTSPW